MKDQTKLNEFNSELKETIKELHESIRYLGKISFTLSQHFSIIKRLDETRFDRENQLIRLEALLNRLNEEKIE